MNNIYIPYTYLIGWSQLNMWYYGVQYNKRANPINLWVNYFTSSTRVKEFRKLYGDPDVIMVRRVFTDGLVARLWEDSVLRSIPETKRCNWLNVKFGNTFKNVVVTHSDKTKLKMSMSHVGRKYKSLTPAHIEKVRLGNLGKKRTPEQNEQNRLRQLGKSPPNKGIPHSDTTREKISVSCTGKVHSEETKAKMRGPRGPLKKPRKSRLSES